MDTVEKFTSLFLVVLVVMGMSVWMLLFLLDDHIAMAQCLRHHSLSTCHYELYR